MGTRAQVTGEHLQGGSIAGQGVRVGQQQLEPVTTAPEIVNCQHNSP